MPNLPKINTDLLRSKLKLKSLQSENLLTAHHGPAIKLLQSVGIRPGKLRAHAKKLLTATAATATIMLTPGSAPMSHSLLPAPSIQESATSSLDLHTQLVSDMKEVLPASVQPLTEDQETKISQVLHQRYGLHAYARLEGNHLNTSYGLIGAEQHLPRFPGDTVEQHDAIQKAGITPGRGAWGYFAYSKADLTPDLIAIERYYAVVQTLYLPDWTTRLAYLRDWYKHRKVAIINPVNGKVMISAIADAGPAAWTGKHFGGSPEVMAYLGLNVGKQKGPVVLFFVDDPEDKVPLGPLENNLEANQLLLTSK
ncbi:MAG: hypothetical protein AAB909_01505 [Patescibacteria group bacterium]